MDPNSDPPVVDANYAGIDLPIDLYERIFSLSDFNTCLKLLLLSKTIKERLYNSSAMWMLMVKKYLTTGIYTEPYKFPFEEQLSVYSISWRDLFIKIWTRGYWYYKFYPGIFDVEVYNTNKRYIVTVMSETVQDTTISLITRRQLVYDTIDSNLITNPHESIWEVGYYSDPVTLFRLAEANNTAIENIGGARALSNRLMHFFVGFRELFEWFYNLNIFKAISFEAKYGYQITFLDCTFTESLYIEPMRRFASKNSDDLINGKVKNRPYTPIGPVNLKVYIYENKPIIVTTISSLDGAASSKITMSSIRGENNKHLF